MVTSSPIALALGMEKGDEDIMRVPPRSKATTLFTKLMVWDMMVYGTIMGILSLGSFMIASVGDSFWGESAYCYTHQLAEGEIAKNCVGIYAAR
jgi:magnesium-transporting ATPase (P-type)